MSEFFNELTSILSDSRYRSLAENSPLNLLETDKKVFKSIFESMENDQAKFNQFIYEVLDYLE